MKLTLSFQPVNKYEKKYEGVFTYVLQMQEQRPNGKLQLTDVKVTENTFNKAEIGKNITIDVDVACYMNGNFPALSIKEVALNKI